MSFVVNRTELAWIPMSDGTKLAAKLWIPELADKSTDKSVESEQYPAILGEKMNSVHVLRFTIVKLNGKDFLVNH